MTRVRKSCGNCVAYRIPDKGPAGFGYCHAKPPIAMQGFSSSALSASPIPVLQGVWPPTKEDEWCREWQSEAIYNNMNPWGGGWLSADMKEEEHGE